MALTGLILSVVTAVLTIIGLVKLTGITTIVVGIILCFIAILFGIAGIIVSALALKRDNEKKPMKIIGLILSCVFTGLALISSVSCVSCIGCVGCKVVDAVEESGITKEVSTEIDKAMNNPETKATIDNTINTIKNSIGNVQ